MSNNTPQDDALQVPKPDNKDIYYIAGKAFSNILPFAGPEIFELLVTPSLEKRREAWMEKVREAILQLQERKGIRIEDLQNNEEFISVLISASRQAMRTHQLEKLQLLKNSLINVLSIDLPADVKEALLDKLDRISVTGYKILVETYKLHKKREAFLEELKAKGGTAINPIPDPRMETLGDEIQQIFNGDSSAYSIIKYQLKELNLIGNSDFITMIGIKFLHLISDENTISY